MTHLIETKSGSQVTVNDLSTQGQLQFVQYFESQEYEELPPIWFIHDEHGYDLPDNVVSEFYKKCERMFLPSAPELDAVDYTRGGMDIMTAAKEKAEEAMMGEAK